MPGDGRPENGSGGDGEVKVTDRRRFTREGEPAEGRPAEAPGAEEPSEAPPEDDRDRRLIAAELRVDELLRAYAAAVDEQKAYRARMERERQRVLDAERAQVAQALLESMDDLERALDAFSAAGETPKGAVAALVEGVRLALAVLSRRVVEMGAERLSLVGMPFDPRVAEAVDLVPVSEAAKDHLVVEEVRAGYRIGDRVLRPARVRVGKLISA